jgi:hypothetical protein
MREGALYSRVDESSGIELTVYQMTFGKARLCTGQPGAMTYDDGWCYSDPRIAIEAAMHWNGEGDAPLGWHRQISTGRRRENPFDPSTEYVAQ